MKKNIYEYFRNFPISINNYYGDPVIQWDDTIDKLKVLEQDGHTGPVGIITKGFISIEKAEQLQKFNLNLVVFISISELPKELEPIGQEHRYESIKNLVKSGIHVIGYIRPFTPPYNTNLEVIEKIFRCIQNTGCQTVVVSGFRGDDAIVKEMNPEEKQKWVLRVKQMPKDVGRMIDDMSEKYSIRVFTRTSCAISYVLGHKSTYNPYYNSPIGAGCDKCPIKDTCGHLAPDEDVLQFARILGYDVEYVEGKSEKCTVTSDNRLTCPSCCTSCYLLDVPHIVVKNENIGLGDITFLRFLTGTLVNKKGVVDGGASDVAHVHFPLMQMPDHQVHCLNTWFVWAKQTNKCFGCKYCILSVYDIDESEYGCSPKNLANYIERMLKNGK